MLVRHPWTSRETDAHLEEGFTDTVDVSWSVFVDRLFVHRFPERTSFDVGGIESHPERLDVVVGLAVGDCSRSGMSHTSSATYGSGYYLSISFFLSFYLKIRVESSGAEPEIGVEGVRCRGVGCRGVRVVGEGGIAVHVDTLNVFEELAVEGLDVLVVGDVVADHSHLTSSDASTNVAHTIVESDRLMLIVGV